MKGFSIGEAVGEAFGLLARRPLSMFGWGVLMLLPGVFVAAAMLSVMGSGAWTAEPKPDMAAFWQLQIASQLSNLVQIVLAVLVTTAIYRAVFAGKKRSAFLGFGMQELQVAVAWILIFVVMFAIMVAAILLGGGLVAGIWSQGVAARWTAGVGVGLVAFVLILIANARLSLLPPAAVRFGGFGLNDGWRLGRGQTARLFLLQLAIFLVALALGVAMILMFLIVALGLRAVLGAPTWSPSSDPQTWFRDVPSAVWLATAVVGLPLFAIVQSFSQALNVAPAASALAQLADAEAARLARKAALADPQPTESPLEGA